MRWFEYLVTAARSIEDLQYSIIIDWYDDMVCGYCMTSEGELLACNLSYFDPDSRTRVLTLIEVLDDSVTTLEAIQSYDLAKSTIQSKFENYKGKVLLVCYQRLSNTIIAARELPFDQIHFCNSIEDALNPPLTYRRILEDLFQFPRHK